MSCTIEIFRHYRPEQPLEEVLKDENRKKGPQRKNVIFVRIKAFDIQNKTFVELKLNFLDYILLRSSGQILLRNYEICKEYIKKYVIKCLENKYIISPSNNKEEIEKYCKSLYY